MFDPKILGNLKKDIKKNHQELMSKVPPEQRAELQSKLNQMIDEAKQGEHKGTFMDDFMKEIYGR